MGMAGCARLRRRRRHGGLAAVDRDVRERRASTSGDEDVPASFGEPCAPAGFVRGAPAWPVAVSLLAGEALPRRLAGHAERRADALPGDAATPQFEHPVTQAVLDP